MSHRKTRKKIAVAVIVAALIVVVLITTWYLSRYSIPVMQPRGPMAAKERNLMFFALILAFIVVVPTFGLAIFIAHKYREENHTAGTKYTPDFDHNRLYESIWWGIPIVIIGTLSVVAWNSAHSLDPYKSLVSDKAPLTVRVVAMDWKWLFIYPQQHVASVNLAAIPVGTPVDFQVTSDSVMNSFWVPQLGGQIYAMPGMSTELHLLADKPGDYLGSPANIAGKGFARMDFTIRATSAAGFDQWLQTARQSKQQLNGAAYAALAKPSMSVPVRYYGSVQPNLYTQIVTKYMSPDPVEATLPAGQGAQ